MDLQTIQNTINPFFETIESCTRSYFRVGNPAKTEGEVSARLIEMQTFCLAGQAGMMSDVKTVLLEHTLMMMFGRHPHRKHNDSIVVWRQKPEIEFMTDFDTNDKIGRVYYRLGWYIPGVTSS